MVAGASLSFPLLSFPASLSLPPHNNPIAVLMVTLSAKSEGLDFYRILEFSTVPVVENLLSLSLSFSPEPSSVFLSLLNLSFLPPRWPWISLSPLSGSSSPQLICHRCLLRQQFLLFLLLVLFHHPEIPTMTGLYQLVYKSNSDLISCICCAIVPLFFVSLYLQTSCLYCIMFSGLC